MAQEIKHIYKDKVETTRQIDKMRQNGWKVFAIQNIGDGQFEVIYKNWKA